MMDLRYGYANNTQFTFAMKDYAEATGQEIVNPKIFAFIAENTDSALDWDLTISMAADAGVSIVIIDINYVTEDQVKYLVDRLKYRGFERDLDSYEDRLCFTCD